MRCSDNMSKDVDIEEEIQRIARKSNLNIRKSEYFYDNQLKKVDEDIENISKRKIKQFDEIKELTDKYLSIDYKDETVERYRRKLKKI